MADQEPQVVVALDGNRGVVLLRPGPERMARQDIRKAPRAHVLAHPTRQSILAQITHSPGVRANGLLEQTILRGRGLWYHLNRLQKAGLVSRSGRTYRATAEGATSIKRLRLLQSGTAASLLVALGKTSHGRTLERLGKSVGTNHATTAHYVRRLVEVGLVVTWWGGKANYTTCSPEGRRYAAWLASDSKVPASDWIPRQHAESKQPVRMNIARLGRYM